MCVSQFRDYCSVSTFRNDIDGQFVRDMDDSSLEVGPYYNSGDGRPNRYYVTDLRKMEKLSKKGNPYARNHLKPKGFDGESRTQLPF